MKDERNKTGRIRPAMNPEELAKSHYWLEVREGGARSPLLEGDNIKVGSDKSVWRLEKDEKARLGFWIGGDLTKAFQPLKALIDRSACRVLSAYSSAGRATGS